MSQQKRCKVCSKKVRTDAYLCKCDQNSVFCTDHKFPFSHNCTINKFKENQKHLSENLVQLKKVQNILKTDIF
jgi:hypothetical protein